MNQVVKFFSAMILVCLPLAVSANVNDEYATCERLVKAGHNVPWYEPSRVAQTSQVSASEEIRSLEAPMCVEMDTVSGKKVVPIKAGTVLVFPKAGANLNVPVRHPKCNNAIYSGRYVATAPATTLVAVTATTAIPTATLVVGSATNVAAVVVNNNVNVGAAPAAASATCATPPCVPHRKTELGDGGWCKVTSGKLECNFPWKVLRSTGDLEDCGCQVRIPAFKETPEQIVGFKEAAPGSKRCLQQKDLFAKAIGVTYIDKRK